MNYIILQAYGLLGIVQEAKFCLVSILKTHSEEELRDIKFLIYTDQEKEFIEFQEYLNIQFFKINPEILIEFRGEIDFVHRVKIKVILHCLEISQGNFLYMDTDVIVQNSLSSYFKKIQNNQLIMHLNEGEIKIGKNIILSKTRKFLNENKVIQLQKGDELEFIFPKFMYNAGVLGFNSSHLNIIQNVLLLTDSIYPKFPKHIVEQFAFSYFFQINGEISEAKSDIFHYWNLKEFREELSIFFTQFNNVVEYKTAFFTVSPVKKSLAKINFYQKSGIERAVLRWIGKGIPK